MVEVAQFVTLRANMGAFRCLLLLTILVAAVSATFHHKLHSKHHPLVFGGRYHYISPRKNHDKCLSVFGFMGRILSSKMKTASNLFRIGSSRAVARTIDEVFETIIIILRGIGRILDNWITGRKYLF
ncbi:uncharacterized protein [Epargyreus clarus]|uniref:uncharacterized protein n=1 Tax=Epargyreus clarus TaxID=520877 RepID=UPI003C2D88A1